MRTLGWMQRIFTQSDGKSTNVAARKSCSCFSSLWELDEQQHYAEKNSANLRQPRLCQVSPIAPEAHEVEKVNEENTVITNPEFFHGFLAIGTLGTISMAKEAITPTAAITKEETRAAGNKWQFPNKMLEKLTEKNVYDENNESCKGMNTKENNNMVVHPLKQNSEMPATNEAEEQTTMPDKLYKKSATSYKRWGKLDKGERRETHALHFMMKMLKKIKFTQRCSPASAGGFVSLGNSTIKHHTKVVRKSGKIHAETADLLVTKSYHNEVKKMSYDREVTLEEEDNMYPQADILKKEMVNNQPAEKKAHWITTDADYFVLEF